MPRILAIDYGKKRTGLAVTDPLQIIASPLETVRTHELIGYLEGYFEAEEVEAVVIGMPRRLNNEATHSTEAVEQFMKHFAKKFPQMPLHAYDERFTTNLALDAMIEGGSKKSDRTKKAGKIDTVSAAIILQDYMERKKNAL